jgi:transposase
MIHLPSHTRVFLAPGSTDLRKAINGLSLLVEGTLELDPFSGHMFVFCNRSRTIVKVLYWDRNGFRLWQKRLEKHRFTWPKSREEVMEIRSSELGFLLEGLDLRSVHPHEALKYATLM